MRVIEVGKTNNKRWPDYRIIKYCSYYIKQYGYYIEGVGFFNSYEVYCITGKGE